MRLTEATFLLGLLCCFEFVPPFHRRRVREPGKGEGWRVKGKGLRARVEGEVEVVSFQDESG